jgi:hypothetical protein
MRIKIETLSETSATAKFYGLTKAGTPSKTGKSLTVTFPVTASRKGVQRRFRKAVTEAGLAPAGVLVPVEWRDGWSGK